MVKTLISDYPWYCPIFCLMFALTATAIAYWNNKKLEEISKKKIAILATLRCSALFFAALLLLSIYIKIKSNYQEKPILAIAIDNSSSLMKRGQQKNDSLKDFINQIDILCKNLEEKYTIKKYTFGNSTQPYKKTTFDEKSTNFSQMTETFKNTFYNTNLGAVVICSDGIYNKGQNPIYSATDLKSKIYTVALGDTTKYKDISISKIIYNETAFIGNEFPINITANAQMLNSKQTVCEIYHKGKIIFSQNININSQNFSQEIAANIPAQDKGLQKYTIKIKPLDGEISTQNNTRDIIIDIADDKYKILILSHSPHPDVAALRNALTNNPAYEIETANIDDFKKSVTAYNLVILVNLPSNNQNAEIVKEIKNKNIPSIFIIGKSTSLNIINTLNNCVNINQTGTNYEDAIARLNPDFQLFTFENTAESFFKQAPPLSCPFGDYKTTNGAQTLMYQTIRGIETSKPLITISNQTTSHTAVIVGEGLWRWRIDNYKKFQNHEIFDLFIGRIVQFLITKDNKENFTVETKRIFNEDEPITFNAKLTDEKLSPIENANVTLEISDSASTKNLKFTNIGNGYFLKIDPLSAGTYSYVAKASANGKNFTKKGNFSVSEIKLEDENLTANHQMLNKLATNSNGKMFFANQIDQLQTELLKNNVKPIIYTETATDDIMNKKWPFFLIIMLLCAEWFLRKFWGFL